MASDILVRSVNSKSIDVEKVLNNYKDYLLKRAKIFCAVHIDFDVDEIYQELLITTFRAYKAFNSVGPATFSTYLRKCINNEFLEILKKSRKKNVTSQLLHIDETNSDGESYESIFSSSYDINTELSKLENNEILSNYLDQCNLNPNEYEIIKLSIINPECLSFVEIAEIIGLTRQRVMQIYNTALGKIVANPVFCDIFPEYRFKVEEILSKMFEIYAGKDKTFYGRFEKYSDKWIEYFYNLLNSSEKRMIDERYLYGIDYPSVVNYDKKNGETFHWIIYDINFSLEHMDELIHKYYEEGCDRFETLDDYLSYSSSFKITSNLVDWVIGTLGDYQLELLQKRFGPGFISSKTAVGINEFELYELILLCDSVIVPRIKQHCKDLRKNNVNKPKNLKREINKAPKIIEESSFFSYFCEIYGVDNADIAKRNAEILCLLLGRVDGVKFSIRLVAKYYQISVFEVIDILEKAKNIVSSNIFPVSGGYCYKKCYNSIGGNSENN